MVPYLLRLKLPTMQPFDVLLFHLYLACPSSQRRERVVVKVKDEPDGELVVSTHAWMNRIPILRDVDDTPATYSYQLISHLGYAPSHVTSQVHTSFSLATHNSTWRNTLWLSTCCRYHLSVYNSMSRSPKHIFNYNLVIRRIFEHELKLSPYPIHHALPLIEVTSTTSFLTLRLSNSYTPRHIWHTFLSQQTLKTRLMPINETPFPTPCPWNSSGFQGAFRPLIALSSICRR